ncbi:hypothetical protein GCM10009584_03310 [Ornithinimicrobium humiphilum]|uniref:Phage integrase family protein n=1 Tax=Ornithinimicrobium humiphilum TaxID=125288 RepID=A0A543K7M5_9MICO|nr:hypothetical protein [Ornithinimicrobium humiphilum]TQM91065.1 hypothetical protein FB476_2785 [Ornithinimicrobium humiphilum]
MTSRAWARVEWSRAAESVGVQVGVTPVEVQRILGQSTPATTLNLYTHLLPEALDGMAAVRHPPGDSA